MGPEEKDVDDRDERIERERIERDHEEDFRSIYHDYEREYD